MIIKLTLIGMAFVPLIIGEASENPTGNDTTTTRVGKFFGWLAGRENDPFGIGSGRRFPELLTRLFFSDIVPVERDGFCVRCKVGKSVTRGILSSSNKKKKDFPLTGEFPTMGENSEIRLD